VFASCSRLTPQPARSGPAKAEPAGPLKVRYILKSAARPWDTFAAVEPTKTVPEASPASPVSPASAATEPFIRDDEWFDPLGDQPDSLEKNGYAVDTGNATRAESYRPVMPKRLTGPAVNLVSGAPACSEAQEYPCKQAILLSTIDPRLHLALPCRRIGWTCQGLSGFLVSHSN